MRFLFMLGTPHHIHFFKNFIWELEKKGHKIKIVSRKKECTIELLNAYFKNYDLVKFKKTMFGKLINLARTDFKLIPIVRSFKPDIMMGCLQPYIAHVGKLMKIPVYTFNDTEHAKLLLKLTIPFSSKIITGESYELEHGKNHITYPSYQELAYLHPDLFYPDENVLDELGISYNEPFSLVRFVSWEASHDVGQTGLSIYHKRELINLLSRYGRVLLSSEGEVPNDLKKYLIKVSPVKIHDVVNYCSLYVGEGATIAAEAAVLGVPSVYVNTLRMGYTNELENKYGLLFNFSGGEEAIQKVRELVGTKDLKEKWIEKRNRMLNDKINTTAWMVDHLENIGKLQAKG